MWCKGLHIFDLRMPYQVSIQTILRIAAYRPVHFQQNQANKNKSRLHYYLDIVSSGHRYSSDKHQRVHFEWLKRYLRNSKSMNAPKDRMNNRSVTKKTEQLTIFRDQRTISIRITGVAHATNTRWQMVYNLTVGVLWTHAGARINAFIPNARTI